METKRLCSQILMYATVLPQYLMPGDDQCTGKCMDKTNFFIWHTVVAGSMCRVYMSVEDPMITVLYIHKVLRLSSLNN